MNKKSTIITWSVVGVIIIAIIIIAAYNHHKNSEMAMTQSGSSTQMTEPTPSPTPTAAATPTATGAASLSYQEALKKYPERFQFNSCQGTPATIAVRKNTPVMLDNRDKVGHTFVADKQTFKLGGYGYYVFYPETVGNLTVTCDGKNSVTLNVEQ